MKNSMTKALAAALAAALALSPVLPASAAEEAPRGKEEVVYINLTPDGAVDTVEVVNIFELDQPGRIVDHGPYTSVRNMTTTDPVSFDGDTVTVEAGAGRLYYEGSLPDAEIPWIFDIRYLLDGAACPADELAGRSGALEMRLTARENPRCRGGFFDRYALQIAVTLDGDKCQNIDAPGATVANVGSDKQLNFTILPGKGADITVKAQVTDFAMDAVAINGVPLALDAQVDDEELMGQITELVDAIAALDEGADTLSDGTAELAAGADTASEGASALYAGASSLQTGAGELQAGGTSVQSGAWSVSSGASEVDAGAQSLKSGLDTLGAGLTALNSQSAALNDGSSQVLAALQAIQAGLSGGESIDTGAITATLTGLESQVDSLTSMLGGMDGLSDALMGILTSLQGVSGSLKAVMDSRPDDADLQSQLGAVKTSLDAVINSYLNILVFRLAPLQSLDVTSLQTALASAKDCLGQLSGMTGSLSDLKAGVDTLTAQYATLDESIQAYTAGVAEVCGGYSALAEGAASLAEGASSLAKGAGSLYSGAASLAGGISDVYAATGALATGAGSLDSGVDALAQGAATLGEGVGQMKEGTAALAEGADGMDEKIRGQIDGMLESVTGGSGQPESFVSAKNGLVSAVQFVIRTPAIEKAAPPAQTPAPTPEPSFLEKLTDLF